MVTEPVQLLTPRAQGTSPDWVRISMASAVALRFRSGRFSRDFDFGGINLLLHYEDGCRPDCGYCGLAPTRPRAHEDKSFLPVEGPPLPPHEPLAPLAQPPAEPPPPGPP